MIGQYEARRVSGDYFEARIRRLLGFRRNDRRQLGLIDLVSQERDLAIECKSGAFQTGGVIREKQLEYFGTLDIPIWYAFVFHSVSCKNGRAMGKYTTGELLKRALRTSITGTYMFPLELIQDVFAHFPQIDSQREGQFLRLAQARAEKLFQGDTQCWSQLSLNYEEFTKHEIDEVKILV